MWRYGSNMNKRGILLMWVRRRMIWKGQNKYLIWVIWIRMGAFVSACVCAWVMNAMNCWTVILDLISLWGEWMGVFAYVTIGIVKHRSRYGIWGVRGQIKYTEVYNCVGSTIIGLSVEVFLWVNIGDGAGREEWMPVGMVTKYETLALLSDYIYRRGRLEL